MLNWTQTQSALYVSFVLLLELFPHLSQTEIGAAQWTAYLAVKYENNSIKSYLGNLTFHQEIIAIQNGWCILMLSQRSNSVADHMITENYVDVKKNFPAKDKRNVFQDT